MEVRQYAINPFTDVDEYLVECCIEGNLDGVKLALDRGANINYSYSIPIAEAASNDHFDIVRYLMDHKDIVICMIDDIFIYAADKGQYDIVDCLVEHIDSGYVRITAYNKARKNCHKEVAELIKEYLQPWDGD